MNAKCTLTVQQSSWRRLRRATSPSSSYVNAWAVAPCPRSPRTSLERLIAGDQASAGRSDGGPEGSSTCREPEPQDGRLRRLHACLDGSDKDWTMTELYFEIGRLCGFLTFETATPCTRGRGQRVLSSSQEPPIMSLTSTRARANFVTKQWSSEAWFRLGRMAR